MTSSGVEIVMGSSEIVSSIGAVIDSLWVVSSGRITVVIVAPIALVSVFDKILKGPQKISMASWNTSGNESTPPQNLNSMREN